jgi:NAD-dependent dihydropyrimidine dehydrogenase PreA subunit
MVVREIVRIDEEKCNGCGDCIPSCHEGAIRLVDGKARVLDEQLCDGLGACLGTCPQGAITVERREAPAFEMPRHEHSACPGSGARSLSAGAAPAGARAPARGLASWPVQLHLLGPMAPFVRGADVLLCADCVAYALGGLPAELADGRVLAIACPKLDQGQEVYLEKLVAMIDHARIRSLTVARMEVPCCRGLVALAQEACRRAERRIPVSEVVVGIEGGITEPGTAGAKA